MVRTPVMAAKKLRLDERLVADGLAESRAKAQALVMSGVVAVDGAVIDKPGTRIAPASAVELRASGSRFVSRGGDKLAGALDDLGVDPAGLACLDLGASTGGFTDCLLQRGAARVYAVDVGYGQLDAKLRGDPRVVVLERTNARALTPEQISEPIDLVVADLAFISLRLVVPALAAVAPAAQWLLLVKPQFEVGREQVGKGGVVRDDGLRASAVDAVRDACRELGWTEIARVDSRVHGPKGNREIFLHLRKPSR
jgi:23S rRNA (cytidine1920-2'-O)/16S rRNA (cytidine1409-2'-O)-methyltransferase